MFRVVELLEATGGRLIKQAGGVIIKGISIDSRTIKPQHAFIAIKGSNFDGHDFIEAAIRKGATCIIKEAGSNKLAKKAIRQASKVTFIEVKDTVKALGDIARFQRKKFFNIPVVAITGSNGKTTTKEMVSYLLSQKFKVLKNEGTKNNQIGLPLTLLNLNSSHSVAILEIGTNHSGEVDYLTRICQPNIGMITNIGPSHLECLRNLEGVFREKYSLIENLEKPYLGILNADDKLLRRKVFARKSKTIILGFGIRNHCDFFASNIKISKKIEFLVNKKYRFTLKTLGYYNIYNALAAITVAQLFGIAYADLALRLASFDFPQNRLKFIKINKIKFIDDTYNSNPLSLRQALSVLNDFKTKGRKIFVMGDMLELGNYQEKFHCQAGREAARCCDIFITVGRLSKLAARAAKSSSFGAKNIFTCHSTLQARDILFNKVSVKEDDIVLVKGSRLMKMEEVFKT